MTTARQRVEDLELEEKAQVERLHEVRDRLRVAAEDYWAVEYGLVVGALVRVGDEVRRVEKVERFGKFLDCPTLQCSRWAVSQNRWGLKHERLWPKYGVEVATLTPAETAEFQAAHPENNV